MTREEILARLREIQAAAGSRSFTDAEITEIEGLEAALEAWDRSDAARARIAALGRPAPGIGPVGAPAHEDGLERAFVAYLRTGQPNADISGLRAEQSEGVSTAGGYTVPPGFLQRIVEAQLSYGGLAPQVETITTDSGQPLEWPTLDDTANSGAIVAENAAPASGADLAFGTAQLGAYKYVAAGADGEPLRVPVELIQDSAFDIAGLVARKLGERIARTQAPHWVTGTGVGQPKGLLASSLTSDRDLDTADTPDYEDLVDLTDLLDEAYDPGAVWLMRRNTWSQLRLIVDTNGRPIIQSAMEGISGRPARTLLGKPVVIDEAVPLLSSAGDTYCMAYGDLRQAYVIRRVRALTVLVDPYTRGKYGQVAYHAWDRADGTIQNRSAYVIMQNNT